MADPLLRKVDCCVFRADDLDAAVRFYSGRLGQPVLWRTDEAVAFAFPESDAEIVVHSCRGPEVELLVDKVDQAYQRLLDAGAAPLMPPFDIRIGRCAVVKDPFDNTLVILDQSKGRLVTDSEHRVVGVR
jgi:lactoylglutathione lyase